MVMSKAQHTAHRSVSQPYQLLPPLSDDEFASLKADIRVHGVLVPIELDADGVMLDGHHRLRAWTEGRACKASRLPEDCAGRSLRGRQGGPCPRPEPRPSASDA